MPVMKIGAHQEEYRKIVFNCGVLLDRPCEKQELGCVKRIGAGALNW